MVHPVKESPAADNPIESRNQDRLGRADIASQLAEQVRGLDASHGLVVAIMGPWGNGKTSFVNLMREQFAGDPALAVIDFNPWMFSGAQQLTEIFFTEVAAELRLKGEGRFEAIADGLDQYGDVLGSIASVFAPLGPAALGGGRLLARAAAKIAGLRRGGTRQLHEAISIALASLSDPVVVFIDDIDRLTTDEIRDIFKLVRLTGSFPNLVYVLAFDRERVERALDEVGVPGRSYLEKIVQLGFDLPAIASGTIQAQTLAELDRLLGDLPDERFDADRWPDIFVELVEPLFKNLRDVSRFALSARPTLVALGPQIDFADLVALEAIRVFRPELFVQLPAVATELTAVRSYSASSRAPSSEKLAIENLVASAGGDDQIVLSLIARVFPAARQYIENYSYGHESASAWRTAHRVADIDWLSLYLNRVAPSELEAFTMAEVLLSTLADRDSLLAQLARVPNDQLEDTLDALRSLAGSYPPEAVVPASIVFENLIPDIPERPRRGMLDFNRPEIVVARIVLQLMMKLEQESEREAATLAILPSIETFSSKLEFIRLVGHIDGAGHKLISEIRARDLETEFTDQVLRTSPAHPDREWDATRVYYFVSERSGGPVLQALGSADLVRALFRSAKSTNVSQSMSSRSLRSRDVLWWDGLVTIAGSEDALKEPAEMMRSVDGQTPLVELVDKYISGWRPNDWDDRDAPL